MPNLRLLNQRPDISEAKDIGESRSPAGIRLELTIHQFRWSELFTVSSNFRRLSLVSVSLILKRKNYSYLRLTFISTPVEPVFARVYMHPLSLR